MSGARLNPHGFAALLPVIDGAPVDQAIAELNRRPRSPFADLEQTHFARLLVVRLRSKRGAPLYDVPLCLYFAVEFDGACDDYLIAVAGALRDAADRVFECCEEYPGVASPEAFVSWLGEHRIDARFSIIGNPGTSVETVRRVTALRRKIIDFAVDAHDLRPAALAARWNERWPAR